LHTLFLENEAQINKNNYATMLFISKQVSLPKISSILQKIKIGPKCYIHPFCTKAFIYQSNSIFTIALQLDVVLESNLSTIRVLEAIQKKLQR